MYISENNTFFSTEKKRIRETFDDYKIEAHLAQVKVKSDGRKVPSFGI